MSSEVAVAAAAATVSAAEVGLLDDDDEVSLGGRRGGGEIEPENDPSLPISPKSVEDEEYKRPAYQKDAIATVQVVVKGQSLAITIDANENALEKAESFVNEYKLKPEKYLAAIERELLLAQVESCRHLRDRLVFYIDTSLSGDDNKDNVNEDKSVSGESSMLGKNCNNIDINYYDQQLKDMNEEVVEIQLRLNEKTREAEEFKEQAERAEESANALAAAVMKLQKLVSQIETKTTTDFGTVTDKDAYINILLKKCNNLEKENRKNAIANRRQSIGDLSASNGAVAGVSNVQKISPEVKALRQERAELTMQIQALKAENQGLKDEMVSVKKPLGRRTSIAVNGVAPVGRRASIVAGGKDGQQGLAQMSLTEAAKIAMSGGGVMLNEGEVIINTKEKIAMEKNLQELESRIRQIQGEKQFLDDQIFIIKEEHHTHIEALKSELETFSQLQNQGEETFTRNIVKENKSLKADKIALSEEISVLRYEVGTIKDKTVEAMKAFKQLIELDENLTGSTDMIIEKLELNKLMLSGNVQLDFDEPAAAPEFDDETALMNETEKLIYKFRNFLHKRNTLDKEELKDDSDIINPMVEDRLLRGVYARYVSDSKSQVMNLTRFCRFAREFEVIDPGVGAKTRNNSQPDSPFLVSGQVDMIFRNSCKYLEAAPQEKAKAFCSARINTPNYQLGNVTISIEQFKFSVQEIADKLYGKIVEAETGTVLECLPIKLRQNVSRSLMDLFMNSNILPMAEKLDLLPWPLMFMDQGVTALSSGDQTFDVLAQNFDNLYGWFEYYTYKERCSFNEGLSIISISRFAHDFAITPYLLKEYQIINLFDEIMRWGNGIASMEMLESFPDVYKQLLPNLLIYEGKGNSASSSKKITKYEQSTALKKTLASSKPFDGQKILFNGFAFLFLTISVQIYFTDDSSVRLKKLVDWIFKSGGPALILREKTESIKKLAGGN